ncbi:GNAT family N-acetyltransferase [Desertimonas flava]|uniref:GNAT family N-acetyltransferase n=1 Tax=Desertimonas flava TaxID=2064846 RepID=UPI000E341AE6|nr:GNAT family N-acetyltransferase [Desertimonas flava]
MIADWPDFTRRYGPYWHQDWATMWTDRDATVVGDIATAAMPALLHPVPDQPGRIHVSPPSGEVGVFSHSPIGIEALCRWLAAAGVVSAFLPFDPRSPVAPTVPRLDDAWDATVRPVPPSIVVDLERWDRAAMSANHRRNLAAAERAGVAWQHITDDGPHDDVARFVDLYRQTARRNRFAARHDLTADQVLRLLAADSLQPRLYGAWHDGRLVAGVTTLLVGEIATFHWSATADDYARSPLAPSKAALYWALEDAKLRGARFMLLGGGMTAGDDLEQFKRRFGAHLPVVPQFALEIVFDRKAHRAACAARPVKEGWFPSWQY